MKYKIFYTESAKQDLRNIHKYISEKLLEPKIAADLTNRLMKGIRSLEEMPMRYRLYESEPWHSRGLRVYPIENYVVFYLADDETAAVKIVRILYGGRDISRQLSET